jgi:hypothetical protein
MQATTTKEQTMDITQAQAQQYPALPEPQVGMAGWGVASPTGGDFVSDGYDSPADALAAAQATIVYMAKDGDTLSVAAMRAAHMMDPNELGEWSDLSKDLYGFRVRTVAGLEDVRNSYWGRAYAGKGAPVYIADDEPAPAPAEPTAGEGWCLR